MGITLNARAQITRTHVYGDRSVIRPSSSSAWRYPRCRTAAQNPPLARRSGREGNLRRSEMPLGASSAGKGSPPRKGVACWEGAGEGRKERRQPGNDEATLQGPYEQMPGRPSQLIRAAATTWRMNQ